MYLVLGMLIVGLPILAIGCFAAWRERQYERQA